MKRLALIGSWKRLGFQAGLLAGLGLAFVGGDEKPAVAGGDCPDQGDCSFKKPNLMIIMDYSSSMSNDFMGGMTGWEAAVDAVNQMVAFDGGFFDESMHLGLMRFGHDPDGNNSGTIIVGDTSGIVDGQSLDVHWYDTMGPPDTYTGCTGDDIVTFLGGVDPPLCIGGTMPCSGIGTWTRGAMEFMQGIITQTRADHPDDTDPVTAPDRAYFNLVMTDGRWSSQDGTQELGPASDDPVPVVGDIFTMQDVQTYVVAFGDAVGEGFADDMAAAGGTTAAIDAVAGDIVTALQQVLMDIEMQIIIPECTSGLPRLMIILDASSSMLNVDDGMMGSIYGMMGDTGWDQARDALAGMNSIFDVPVAGLNNAPVEDLVHLGLTVFGSPGEQDVLVDYGPCMKDNFEWALDPNTSCDVGCADPWGGPPIIWTFQDPTSPTYPDFDQDTTSHMPLCDQGMFDLDICTGSATAVHLGVIEADLNADAYRMTPPPLYPIDASTVFANILITDGQFNIPNGSTPAQVETAITDVFANDNTTTYVIGFGDAFSLTELDNMACWGSGGTGVYPNCAGGAQPSFSAATQADLEMALETIIEAIVFDPCCGFNDCSFNPEPTTGEPDPVPVDTTTTDGMTTTTAGETTMGVDDTADSTGPDPTADGSSSDSADGSTSGPTTSGPGMTSTTPTTGDPDTGSTGESDTVGQAGDDGCGCTTDRTPTPALFGLMALGLLGLRRRRS